MCVSFFSIARQEENKWRKLWSHSTQFVLVSLIWSLWHLSSDRHHFISSSSLPLLLSAPSFSGGCYFVHFFLFFIKFIGLFHHSKSQDTRSALCQTIPTCLSIVLFCLLRLEFQSFLFDQTILGKPMPAYRTEKIKGRCSHDTQRMFADEAETNNLQQAHGERKITKQIPFGHMESFLYPKSLFFWRLSTSELLWLN